MPTKAQIERIVNQLAESEGWGIFESGRGTEIQRVDDAGVFRTDDSAMEHVVRLAALGSQAHRWALTLIDRPASLLPSIYGREIFLLVERHEDEGTDWYTVLAVYSTEVDAKAAEAIQEHKHKNEDGEWCECHRLDWRVEGPFLVDKGWKPGDSLASALEAK